MRELLDDLVAWHRDGRRFALATVVATSSSAPRPTGTAMAVADDGEVLGSVSGGCVEADVADLAADVLADGAPRRRRYGISDEEAFAVGLTCGGEIDVAVHLVADDDPTLAALADRVRHHRRATLATVVAPAHHAGRRLLVTPDGTTTMAATIPSTATTPSAGATDAADATDATDAALAAVTAAAAEAASTDRARGEPTLTTVTTDEGPLEVFTHPFTAPPRLLVFGATDFAAALASLGRFTGHHVTVCDARDRFVTPARFPDADDLVVDWPHRLLAATDLDPDDAVCVLTHDAKFDVPALTAALASPAGYVGAMGSRRTVADRRRRLTDAGVAEADLARLHAPIGLDLGASSPPEVAVAIIAEVIASRTGAVGSRLRDTDGPIHRERG